MMKILLKQKMYHKIKNTTSALVTWIFGPLVLYLVSDDEFVKKMSHKHLISNLSVVKENTPTFDVGDESKHLTIYSVTYYMRSERV